MFVTSRSLLAFGALTSLTFTTSAQAPPVTVEGRYVSIRSVLLDVIDKRPPPAERSPTIHTPQGDKDRLDDKSFEQSPVDAFTRALSDQVSAGFLQDNHSTIELAELNVAVGEPKGRINYRVPPTALDASRPIAWVGAGIASAILQRIEDGKGSRPLFLDVVLRFEGKTVACEGFGLFPAEHAAGAWQRAVEQAANICARRLENLPAPETTAGPNRVR
jgi:hypothetical protein